MRNYNIFVNNLILILVFASSSLFSQVFDIIPKDTKYPYSKWTIEQFDEANTAKKSRYMTENERLVILYCNLARIDGPLFAETFLKNHLNRKKLNTSYTQSLFTYLNKRLKPLMPSKKLYHTSKKHAEKSGKDGSVGHNGFDNRFKSVSKNYSYFSENCSYGYSEPLEIVFQLLIDQDVKSLGHRKNILSIEVSDVGVSIKPHEKYKYNCVMNFGGN